MPSCDLGQNDELAIQKVRAQLLLGKRNHSSNSIQEITSQKQTKARNFHPKLLTNRFQPSLATYISHCFSECPEELILLGSCHNCLHFRGCMSQGQKEVLNPNFTSACAIACRVQSAHQTGLSSCFEDSKASSNRMLSWWTMLISLETGGSSSTCSVLKLSTTLTCF